MTRQPDATELAMWQKLMVYTGEQAHYDAQPLHRRLVRDLRAARGAGATCLRGIWATTATTSHTATRPGSCAAAYRS
jgi:PII-like signaling protein